MEVEISYTFQFLSFYWHALKFQYTLNYKPDTKSKHPPDTIQSPVLGAVHFLRHTILASFGPPPLSYRVIIWLTPPYPPHV